MCSVTTMGAGRIAAPEKTSKRGYKGEPRRTPAAMRTGRRLTEAEWAEVERLFVNGATAKSLSERFGPTERTIYSRMSKRGLLRRDQTPAPTPVKDAEGRAAALDLIAGVGPGCEAIGDQAEAPCRELGENATLGEAAAAAARSAINKVRELQPARAYTWARLAGTLEKLARFGGPDASRLGEDPTEPGRRAALDFLREEGVTHMSLVQAPDGPVWLPCAAPEEAEDDAEPARG